MRAEWRRRGLLAAAAWLAAGAPAVSPTQGRLDIVQPNFVAYTPRPGFAGPDEFAYGGSGPGREGQIPPFNVRVSVQVLKPDEPLR